MVGSQNGWGWTGPLKVTWSIPPAHAGSFRSHYPRQCPDSFRISPGMDSLQPHWATCSSAWSSTQWKSVSIHSEGTFYISVGTHCLLCCHWAPPKRAWLHPLGILPLSIYIHYWAFTSPGWAVPSQSVIPYVRDAVAPPSSLWLSKISMRTILEPKELQLPRHDLSESLASSKPSWTEDCISRQRPPSFSGRSLPLPSFTPSPWSSGGAQAWAIQALSTPESST